MKNIKIMLFATIAIVGLANSVQLSAMLRLTATKNNIYVDDKNQTYTLFMIDRHPSSGDVVSKKNMFKSCFNSDVIDSFFINNFTLELMHVKAITRINNVGGRDVYPKLTLYIDVKPRSDKIRYSYDVISVLDLPVDFQNKFNSNYIIVVYTDSDLIATLEDGTDLKLKQ